MKVLGIETSCDETGVGVVEDGKILFNLVRTHAVHRDFGGVVPELAARAHTTLLPELFKKIDRKVLDNIDLIGVTAGPGLMGALISGISFAYGLSFVLNRPVLGIHHIEGHIHSVENTNFPFLYLVVSGGHTELILAYEPFRYKIIGRTVDDACGEAIDKVARLLNLTYPGGRPLENLAKHSKQPVFFKEPDPGGLNFSFSGIKTGVKNFLKKNPDIPYADIAMGFQKAVFGSLLSKTKKAIGIYNPSGIAIVGGVSANNYLRELFLKNFSLPVLFPSPSLSQDNGAMIAKAAYLLYKRFKKILPPNPFPRKDIDIYNRSYFIK